MKYGDTLRQRSIAAWSHHNIDYDDIKRFIKDQTTPGKGKAVSVPGRSDDKLLEFENALFNVLTDQHHRIDLFVRSKAGEIQRRLDHSTKQLRQLSARTIVSSDQRVSLGRLERYGRLETDVLKAGDEIKSLARFTSTQRTAFRKLLKKFKKWTGSTNLDDRFQDEILSDPKSFTNLDLGALLDKYSDTLLDVRELYESHVQQPAFRKADIDAAPVATSSAIARLQTAVDSASKVEFDTAVGAIPLGGTGTFVSYFVHPDCIVELLMLLLNHTRSYASKSRQNSVDSPLASPQKSRTPSGPSPAYDPDYFVLAADDPDRFVEEQNSLTVDDREHGPGFSPQSARICARWNNDEDAQVCARSSRGSTRYAAVKRKHLDTFFDRTAVYPVKKNANTSGPQEDVELRKEVEIDTRIRPLYRMSACRSRFVGLNNSSAYTLLATLDTGIVFHEPGSASDDNKSDFPYAVLSVREDGQASAGLLSVLNESHLVERVRGFCVELHGMWEICKPANIAAPSWVPMLSRDIRKLPPPAIGRGNSSTEGSTSLSATQASDSTVSDRATTTDTAVETGREMPMVLDGAMSTARKSRKKRRRQFPEAEQTSTQQRYWSEYDHPEDEDDQDAFVLYIDPNEKSALDRVFDKIGNFFKRSPPSSPLAEPESPTTPHDAEDSSDEETGLLSSRKNARNGHQLYGAIRDRLTVDTAPQSRSRSRNLLAEHSPPTTSTLCYIAAIALLIVAYFLALTGRKRYHAEVETGVAFSILMSIVFAISGFVSLLRRDMVEWDRWAVTTVVLIVELLGAGGLLAWILGSSLVDF